MVGVLSQERTARGESLHGDKDIHTWNLHVRVKLHTCVFLAQGKGGGSGIDSGPPLFNSRKKVLEKLTLFRSYRFYFKFSEFNLSVNVMSMTWFQYSCSVLQFSYIRVI